MALPFSTPSKLLCFSLLAMTIAMILCDDNGHSHGAKETNLVFYLQDWVTGPNATVQPVTGPSGKIPSYNTFGSVFVVDDPVTLGPLRTSLIIGRAQGMLVATSLDGSNVSVILSIVFTNNSQYNGSTLEIQGVSRQFENYREVSVVSGTGRFRFARGYATLETLSYDPTTTYSVIHCSITLLEG